MPISAVLAACAYSPSPTSVLVGDGNYTASVNHFSVHEVAWLGLPVLSVKGKAAVRVVSVRFAHYPAVGLSAPTFYRIAFTGTDRSSITLYEDRYFREFGHSVSGSYLGTTLRPGDPTGYGVAKIIVEEPGTFTVSDVIVRYAEPDGSERTQTFHLSYVLGTTGGKLPR